jgi:ubiquinone/menaquinone biosynthesis methyltransferase
MTDMSAPASIELTEAKRAERVREMFSAIAPTYDRLNHLLSFNRDKAWRRTAIRMLAPQPNDRILDLCGGTGDLAIECLQQEPQARIVIADFSIPMLRLAKTKMDAPAHAADGLRLPYRDGAFDAVMVAFGVRNLEDTECGVREIRRVLRDGGRLLVLEFFRPTSPLIAFVYNQVFLRVMPLVGRALSGHAYAYSYLPKTVSTFLTGTEFEALLRSVGFEVRNRTQLDGGIASIVLACKSFTQYAIRNTQGSSGLPS